MFLALQRLQKFVLSTPKPKTLNPEPLAKAALSLTTCMLPESRAYPSLPQDLEISQARTKPHAVVTATDCTMLDCGMLYCLQDEDTQYEIRIY